MSALSPTLPSPDFGRIRTIGRRGALLAAACALAVPFAALLYVAEPETIAGVMATQIGLPPGALVPSHRALWIGFAVLCLPLGLTLASFLEIRRLFLAFGEGRVLVGENARILRRIGHLLMALAVVLPLSHIALSAVYTMDAAPGGRMVAVTFDLTSASLAVAGALIFAFATVLAEAIRIQDENHAFI